MSTGVSPTDSTELELTNPTQLVGRGAWLRREFERQGRREDLDQAVAYQVQAVSLTSMDHEDYPIWLDELGVSLQLRFRHFEDLSDITSAVEHHEQAVALTPDAHRDQPKRVKNLGNSLQSRFERLGNISDLKRGISYLNQAIMLAHGNESELASKSGLDTSKESVDITPVKINNSMVRRSVFFITIYSNSAGSQQTKFLPILSHMAVPI